MREQVVSTTSSSVRKKLLCFADSSSVSRILRTGLCLRLILWLAMGISCHVIPSHNPGHDVLKFRLPPVTEESSSPPLDAFGVSLSFHDCHFSIITEVTPDSKSWTSQSMAVNSPVVFLQKSIYPFLLKPLTCWDASRFLTLAHRPESRRPDLNCQSDEECVCPDPFVDSEQSHAFLPLFPLLVRAMAWILMSLFPRTWLPASCQALLVLAGVLLNLCCYLAASLDLYSMTYRLALHHETRKHGNSKVGGAAKQNCDHLAKRTMLLFLLNPANVFFSTVYSEALAAALLFRGCNFSMTMVLESASSAVATGVPSSWSFPMVYAAITWWLAAWVRSNAALYGGFLLLYSMGHAVRRDQAVWRRVAPLVEAALLVFGMVAGSMGVHNSRGYHTHCTIDAAIRPAWCTASSVGAGFNLYGYVQRKHWNVGFLRYYQWKQIPNFILAAPILILSTIGVFQWIRLSWNRQNKDYYKEGKRPSLSLYFQMVVHWAFSALREFAGEEQISVADNQDNSVEAILLSSPYLLGYYAVLAASTLLGITVAHVQISTRLICSSCPALYWFLTVVISSDQDSRGDILLLYCGLYMLLGVILHPNWLPWT